MGLEGRPGRRKRPSHSWLVNDQTLLGKAQKRGVDARFTAEYVLGLARAGKISRERRDRLLADFVANGRYSEEFMQALRLRR